MLRLQVRLGKMSGLLDALMMQFPMPPPALFAANDIDKCVPQSASSSVGLSSCTTSPHLIAVYLHCRLYTSLGSSEGTCRELPRQQGAHVEFGHWYAVIHSCLLSQRSSQRTRLVCGRLLDDDSINDDQLIAGEPPPLLAAFEARAAEDETPYRAIMDSLYFFQACMAPCPLIMAHHTEH